MAKRLVVEEGQETIALGQCVEVDNKIYLAHDKPERRFFILTNEFHGKGWGWLMLDGYHLRTGNGYFGSGTMDFVEALEFGINTNGWEIYRCNNVKDKAGTILKLSNG